MVFIPICIQSRHWVLGALDLDNMHMAVYDTYRPSVYEAPFASMMQKFSKILPNLFKKLRDFPGIRSSKNFCWDYADDVPQQMGATGDYGVWVCKFLSRMVVGEAISATGGAREEARQFRYQMAEILYATGHAVPHGD
ncbi:hypothetical protein L6452_08469 [Arctium lappa]|uniref:Uncharacterized protein n=1 Tax=Arctium lappa TaxID=4217 RepID=A0ACB9DI04_ARCLA|nr:hypothetical protein L6452_08469 [Arctium lappa]